MAGSANNIVINPVDIYWRLEHLSTYSLAGLVATDMDGVSLRIPDSTGDVAIVAFDLDGGSTLPTPGVGERLITVAVSTGDSASVMATAMAAAIDADGAFTSSASTTLVTVKGAAVGEAVDPSDVDSGIAITVCYKGKDFYLGLLEGEPSPTMEPQVFDVMAHQTGTTILSKLVQGFTANVETVMQETTKSQLRELYKIYGEAFTPSGGTEVYGVGTGSIGKNMITEAARLEFVPRNSLGAELSYNYTFRLAIPVPGSLLFSGENPRTLTVTWDVLPDLTATRSKLDTVVIGDINQTGVL